MINLISHTRTLLHVSKNINNILQYTQTYDPYTQHKHKHIPYTMSWRCLLRGIIYTQNTPETYTHTKNTPAIKSRSQWVWTQALSHTELNSARRCGRDATPSLWFCVRYFGAMSHFDRLRWFTQKHTPKHSEKMNSYIKKNNQHNNQPETENTSRSPVILCVFLSIHFVFVYTKYPQPQLRRVWKVTLFVRTEGLIICKFRFSYFTIWTIYF